LKDTPLDDLLFSVFRSSIAKCNIDPALVEDICVGNVLNGNAANLARGAALAAGYPNTTALSVCNRFCSSGLLATQTIANAIREGSIDIGLAVGAESMSQDGARDSPDFGENLMKHQEAKDCLQPMLQTSENVAVEFNIARESQDEFAALSYNLAEAAQKFGDFDEEIVPVETYFEDPKSGERKKITVSKDDGIRYGTTKEALAKVRPAAPQWGKGYSTGGNSSQVTDGAACVLLMKRSTADKLRLPVLAKFVGATVVGLEPRIMGIGKGVVKIVSSQQARQNRSPKFLKRLGFEKMKSTCSKSMKPLLVWPCIAQTNCSWIAERSM